MAENTSPIQVYIENVADPSIGGFTIPFPTTKETLAPWLMAIQADTNNPDSIAVRDVRSGTFHLKSALSVELTSNTQFDELNYLAAKLRDIKPADMEFFHAALDADRYCENAADLINLTENLTCFDLQPAFKTQGYGEFLLETDKDNTSVVFDRLSASEDSEERELAQYILRLEKHVDVEAYARAVIEQEKGVFTEHGYLVEYGQYKKVYRGPEDIPPEYRIFKHDESPAIDKEQFWKIIDSARETAGSWQNMYPSLMDVLSKLDVPDTLHWQQIFREYEDLSYKHKLWAAASVMMNGCSDDSFDYFRGWLIAQGKDVFMNALSDPDSLADVKSVQALAREAIDLEYMPLDGYHNNARFEKMLYAGAKAYEDKTGRDFFDDSEKFPLSQWEKANIADEIKYAEDIDVRWFGEETDRDGLVPRLYEVFHPMVSEAVAEVNRQDKPAEKESVIEKIRNAQAAKKAEPRQPQEKERGEHKKSREPEV